MKPLVSVCIPAFNAGPYLRQTIESVLTQSFANFELVIVDNASTDDTLAIASEYSRRDARIRVFRNETNIGAIANFDRCIDLADGEWIKFLCADDWLEPACIERLLQDSKPGVLLITCVERYVFEAGISGPEKEAHLRYRSDHCLMLSHRFVEDRFISPESFGAVMAADPTFNVISLNSAMVHRAAFERFGRFNRALLTLDDWEFFARVAVHTGLINVPEELTNCRIHCASYGSTMHTKRPFMMEILSPLIIRYEVAYSPHYAGVRSIAQKVGINLRHQLLDAAREARLLVERYARRSKHPDLNADQDWAETIRKYPRIFEMPQDYYFAKLWRRGRKWLQRASALSLIR